MNQFRTWASVLALISLGISVSAYAQSGRERTFREEGEIEEATIVVEKDRQLELPRATRNFDKINFDIPRPDPEPQQYDFRRFDYTPPALSPTLRAVTTKPDPLDKLYGNYVRGGLGNLATTYLEGHFHSKRARDFVYNTHFRHLASARGPVDGTNSGSSENFLKFDGRYFLDQAVVGGGLRYDRQRYNFYGYDQNFETPDRDSIRQVFNSVAAYGTLRSRDEKSPLFYDAQLGASRLVDSQDASENELNLGTDLRYALTDESALLLGVEMAFTQRQDSSAIGRNLVALRPAYRYRYDDKLTLTLGAHIAYENDTLEGTNLHLYPHVRADYALLPGQLTVFAGLTGDMQKNTLRTLLNENPFLAPNVALFHTNKTLEIFTGARGQLAEKWTYEAQVAFQTFRRLPFYVNSFPDRTRFDVVYDDNTVVLNFVGQLSYVASSDLQFDARLDYNGYRTGALTAAWHRPAYRSSLAARYAYGRKIFVSGEVFHNGAVTARNPNFVSGDPRPEEIRLPGLVDVNLQAEYAFSARASAFLRLDNLLSQRNPRYLYYPTRGILVLIGGSYSF